MKKLAGTISMIVWESNLLSELSHTKVVSQSQIFWLWVWVSNHPLPLLLIMAIITRRPDTTHVLDLASYWRETGGNFTTIPQVFIFRLTTVIAIILSSPSFCHHHHFVITIILSSPLFCHHHHFVITIIVIAITVIAITVITTLTTFSSLPSMGTRPRGQGRFSSLIIKRRSSPIHRCVEPPLIGLFSLHVANLIHQTDNLDTTWSSQICSESKISSLALTWQGYHSADSKWNHYEDSSWLALTEQAGRPGDIVLVMLLGGMCAWELYGACIVDWTDGSFP